MYQGVLESSPQGSPEIPYPPPRGFSNPIGSCPSDLPSPNFQSWGCLRESRVAIEAPPKTGRLPTPRLLLQM